MKKSFCFFQLLMRDGKLSDQSECSFSENILITECFCFDHINIDIRILRLPVEGSIPALAGLIRMKNSLPPAIVNAEI
jgi:hypothetical protein